MVWGCFGCFEHVLKHFDISSALGCSLIPWSQLKYCALWIPRYLLYTLALLFSKEPPFLFSNLSSSLFQIFSPKMGFGECFGCFAFVDVCWSFFTQTLSDWSLPGSLIPRRLRDAGEMAQPRGDHLRSWDAGRKVVFFLFRCRGRRVKRCFSFSAFWIFAFENEGLLGFYISCSWCSCTQHEIADANCCSCLNSIIWQLFCLRMFH